MDYSGGKKKKSDRSLHVPEVLMSQEPHGKAVASLDQSPCTLPYLNIHLIPTASSPNVDARRGHPSFNIITSRCLSAHYGLSRTAPSCFYLTVVDRLSLRAFYRATVNYVLVLASSELYNSRYPDVRIPTPTIPTAPPAGLFINHHDLVAFVFVAALIGL